MLPINNVSATFRFLVYTRRPLLKILNISDVSYSWFFLIACFSKCIENVSPKILEKVKDHH